LHGGAFVEWGGVRAAGGERLAAEYGGSGELRFGDHAEALRGGRESAEVQEREGD